MDDQTMSGGFKARSHKRILVVDDEVSVRLAIETVLRKRGYRYSSAQSAAEARELIEGNDYDMVITDWRMENRNAGLEVIRAAIAKNPDTPVLVITAFANVHGAVSAMRAGAYEYIEKPFSIDELEETIDTALRRPRPRLMPPEGSGPASDNPFEGIIGSDPSIRRIFDIVNTISDTDATTLLTGETGTGKELFARAIHRTSRRGAKAFVPVNCGAIPESLFEAELFGYRKGSFTDAKADRPGRFHIADGGSIFLDEIGDLPLSMQVKLLRVLQDKEVQRIGDAQPSPVDVRVIAATHHDLEAAVAKGAFREDLYYRLNVIHIEIPALRERPSDILTLIAHFIRHFNASDRRNITDVSVEAQRALLSYSWPGNIRELENTIERVVILKREGSVDLEDLPTKIRRGGPEVRASHIMPAVALSTPDALQPLLVYHMPPAAPAAAPSAASAPPPIPAAPTSNEGVAVSNALRLTLPAEGVNLKTLIEQIENDLIDQALAQSEGVVSHAARLLQMNRTTLVERLRKREAE